MSNIRTMTQLGFPHRSIPMAARLGIACSLMVLLLVASGCNQRYQPADWAARKAALSTLPSNAGATKAPQGTTLPGHGSTLPGGTTLPYSGSTLPQGPGFGTTLPHSGSTLPSGSVLPSGSTLPR